MKALKIFAKITLIGQIIVCMAFLILAIPTLFLDVDPNIDLQSTTNVLILFLVGPIILIKMIGNTLLVTTPIGIMINAFVLMALNDKSSIIFKKIIMVLYLLLGLGWLGVDLHSILNNSDSIFVKENVWEEIFTSIILFVIVFLPSILYLYMYISKKEKGKEQG